MGAEIRPRVEPPSAPGLAGDETAAALREPLSELLEGAAYLLWRDLEDLAQLLHRDGRLGDEEDGLDGAGNVHQAPSRSHSLTRLERALPVDRRTIEASMCS